MREDEGEQEAQAQGGAGTQGRRGPRGSGKWRRKEEAGGGSDRCRNCTLKACLVVVISLLTEPSFRFAPPPKKILFKHSPLVERPQSYPRVIIVWKLASACLQDLSTPHLCLRIPRRKSAAWSSRRFCSLALIFRPYIAFHVQQFPQTYPAAPPTSSSSPSTTSSCGLMEIRLYLPGPPTSAFTGDMRGAGRGTYRFICSTDGGTEERAAHSSGIFFNCAQ